MQIGPGFLRDLRTGEEARADALLAAAFGGDDEVRLVAALRRSGALAGESVLPWEDRLVGYCALSYMIAPRGWLCLAPVAIDPACQRRGYGRRMVGVLTEWARRSGNRIVVLGEPAFYERAGFSVARARRLNSPYPIPHTLLAGPGHDTPDETLVYPAPFPAP